MTDEAQVEVLMFGSPEQARVDFWEHEDGCARCAPEARGHHFISGYEAETVLAKLCDRGRQLVSVGWVVDAHGHLKHPGHWSFSG